jgi:hypothetical protein
MNAPETTVAVNEMNPLVAEMLNSVRQEYDDYLKRIEVRGNRILEIYNALLALDTECVKKRTHPLHASDLRWGFTWLVRNPADWGKIHKVVGKLEEHGKEVIDEKENKIRVTMRAANHEDKSRYHIAFLFDKKLKDTDKCKIVSKTETHHTVVCGHK